MRGAFVFGGAGGSGVLVVRDEKTKKWSEPAFYTIGSASFGLQVGGDVSELIFVVRTQKGLEQFYRSDVKLGTDTSIALGPAGAGASVKGITADLVAYARKKGVFWRDCRGHPHGSTMTGEVAHVLQSALGGARHRRRLLVRREHPGVSARRRALADEETRGSALGHPVSRHGRHGRSHSPAPRWLIAAALVASSWGRAASPVETSELCQLIQASSQTLVYAPTITTADRVLAQCLFDAARTYRRSVVILSIRTSTAIRNSLVYGLLHRALRADGGAGGDTIDGGSVIDVAAYDASTTAVNVDLQAGTFTGGAPSVGFDSGVVLTTGTTGEGRMVYSVARNGQPLIGESRLGFLFTNALPFDRGVAIESHTRSSADSRWELPWGERRFVRDHHNELAVTFRQQQDGNRAITVRFRLFDDGIGFRYEFGSGWGETRIQDELTEFTVAAPGTAWWITGGDWNRYEQTYQRTAIDAVSTAHTPITMRLENGTHLAFHEAALVDYAGMWLRRVEGQVRGVQQMLSEGRDCRDVVTQISAANKALEQAVTMEGIRPGADRAGGHALEATLLRTLYARDHLSQTEVGATLAELARIVAEELHDGGRVALIDCQHGRIKNFLVVGEGQRGEGQADAIGRHQRRSQQRENRRCFQVKAHIDPMSC
ncbi:MAG: metal-sensing transcriptional repressor [Nitrospiraceae bacterium]|nr:metal-sensing transcriptional repressor [Nitrospiraceae bacterium]